MSVVPRPETEESFPRTAYFACRQFVDLVELSELVELVDLARVPLHTQVPPDASSQ